MIDCSEFERQLPFLICDELEDEPKVELLAHAEQCEPCAAALRVDQSLRAGLQAQAESAPRCPDHLRRRIRNGYRRARAIRVAGGLGGVAACAALAAFMIMPSGDPLDPLVDSTLEYQARRLPADVAFEPKARVEAFLTEQMGRRVDLPQLPQYPVRGARFMPTQGKRGAMIMLGGGPRRVDVLAVEADRAIGEALRKPRVTKRRGREVLQWYRDGMVYSATSANGRTPSALVRFANHSR